MNRLPTHRPTQPQSHTRQLDPRVIAALAIAGYSVMPRTVKGYRIPLAIVRNGAGGRA